MIERIAADTRGFADHGWLKARHTFSFADYHDPKRVHFGPLRVINEDRIAAGQGFGTHPHKDMEIVTYPISGAIEHRDSLGNGSIIRAGDVQRMSAGTGIQHSEFNHSQDEELHLLQIWIFPGEKNLPPGYEQLTFTREQKLNQLRLIASADGRDGSVTVHQDADLYASILQADGHLAHETDPQHRLFVQVVSGDITVNGEAASNGDGLQIKGEPKLDIRASSEAEFLLFDMG